MEAWNNNVSLKLIFIISGNFWMSLMLSSDFGITVEKLQREKFHKSWNETKDKWLQMDSGIIRNEIFFYKISLTKLNKMRTILI